MEEGKGRCIDAARTKKSPKSFVFSLSLFLALEADHRFRPDRFLEGCPLGKRGIL
jgi:hypothetical protein